MMHTLTHSTGDLRTAGIAELRRVEGIIFDVQRYSLHDGPGLRTNVFLKGCPLRCKWCCNPESQASRPELAFFQGRCFACARCVEVCERGALEMKDGELQWDTHACDRCGRCVEVCASEAMRWIGRRVSAGQIMDQVTHDMVFYDGGGGITLTGGEPTMQPALAEAVLRLAKAEYLNTAIETCGHTSWQVFELLLPHLDLVLYDLKHMNSDRHIEGTGTGNELLLENARRIAEGGTSIVPRIPLIPGFNMGWDNIRRVSQFALELGAPQVHVLPYHRLGEPKYRALGRPYSWREFSPPEKAEVANTADLIRSYGLQVKIVGK